MSRTLNRAHMSHTVATGLAPALPTPTYSETTSARCAVSRTLNHAHISHTVATDLAFALATATYSDQTLTLQEPSKPPPRNISHLILPVHCLEIDSRSRHSDIQISWVSLSQFSNKATARAFRKAHPQSAFSAPWSEISLEQMGTR